MHEELSTALVRFSHMVMIRLSSLLLALIYLPLSFSLVTRLGLYLVFPFLALRLVFSHSFFLSHRFAIHLARAPSLSLSLFLSFL